MNRAAAPPRQPTDPAPRPARRSVLGLLFAAPIGSAAAALIAAGMSGLRLVPPADAAPAALNKAQADALDAYNNTIAQFRAVLNERRTQIEARQSLPNLPGQALYLARIAMMSAYKDLTDLLPAKIGRPNRLGIPPAYFDADNEPLLDEYKNLFAVMQAPPADAQDLATPFHDVVDLSTAIARAKGLDAAHAEIAGRIGLGIFFAETNGNQNIGNARSNKYKGSFQTGVSEDHIGQKKWAAMRKTIAAFDPALIARDDQEEARAGKSDHRFNHWTAVRDGLMNAHAALFPQIPAIVQNPARPGRSDEVFRAHPDRSGPDKVRLELGRSARLRDLRPDHHGLFAQQQRLHVRPGRSGANIRDLSRSPRCDVAVQRQVRARARQVR